VLLTYSAPVALTSEGRWVCLELGEATCQTVRIVAPIVNLSADEGRSCLSVCVSVLASLVSGNWESSDSASWEGSRSFGNKLYKLLSDYDVIRSLVWQPSNYSSDQTNSSKIFDFNLRILSLLGNLAVVGDSNILSLLVDSDVSLILPQKSSFPSSSGTCFPMRGYTQSSQANCRFDDIPRNPGARGKDSSEHLVWRASMKFVSAALRTARMCSFTLVSTRLLELALSFLSVNKITVVECLEQCAAVSFDSEFPVLTLNSLREASLILSIVSELCTSGAIDLFKRRHPDLFESLLRISRSLLPSIGSFLGSSGSSRELFRAIEDLEEADAMALDSVPQLAALGPTYYVLAGGISNGRHEAIRYSHFVSRCSTPVTEEDTLAQNLYASRWSRDTRERSPSDPDSLSSLETKCRETVTCRLAFQIENEAAHVLFFALSVLWRTHPTASSFVMYTADEAERLDAMQLVRPGMTIAFRLIRQSCSSLLICDITTASETAETPIYYGNVLKADTVNRRWEVSYCDGGETPWNTTIVTERQLAGIEAPSRRRGILGFAAAPQSSAELLASLSAPCVGHLILILRWCSQFREESEDQVAVLTGGRPSFVVTRLAELVSAFLGTEVSIHRQESSSVDRDLDSSSSSSLRTLALQLLDLFGDEAEFNELFAGTGSLPIQRKGRLEAVVSGDTWDIVRSQLGKELRMATEQLKAKVSRQRNLSVDQGGGAVLVRRSSTRTLSPFRGLGI
jgi:hypothetical protein